MEYKVFEAPDEAIKLQQEVNLPRAGHLLAVSPSGTHRRA
jgi:hypothetical protein